MTFNDEQRQMIIRALQIYKEEIETAASAVMSQFLKKGWQQDAAKLEGLITRFSTQEVGDDLITKGVLDYLRDRQFINAIKYLREKTGMGLAEAKQRVEEIGLANNFRVGRYGINRGY